MGMLVFVVFVVLGDLYLVGIVLEIFGAWALALMLGVGALFVSICIVMDALERRAPRKTVERLLALEPASFSTDWALPAPESYALISGVTKAKRDAFKLGLLQLIAMGVLARGPFQTLSG